ncbi:uncharacterized protein LACBIDRAFT_304120 [Laccaria bicolor S238N-H82]|uniref:Predicted protein n=1 Tax=Laccaria bicolor (strain S238N-H82 / ATCC MYA-4686) TaxID=486041 RepID=B0DKZ8_LACBS|nr:uncharacterized protein LACBIDRAFT_304120 [Laccaria bicolor S238N-H82]EDR04826.1 predicted protein [Laccaria bicolor S238N-H82]|eukprot:XP_001884650.1 predicted protein [Laccaria bicolor S238N-H82]
MIPISAFTRTHSFITFPPPTPPFPPRPVPNPFVGLAITTNCSRYSLHFPKYLTRSTSFPCAGTTLNFSLLFLVTSLATFVNSCVRPPTSPGPSFVRGDV